MDNKQKKMAFLGVLLLGCVATSWLQQGKEAKQAVPAPILNKQLASSTAKEKKEKTIQVYVSGAVREPGIYTLPAGSRTMSALEAAGGMRPDARAERVNLAKKLRDGSHVYVPAVKNTSATTNMTSKASKKSAQNAQAKDTASKESSWGDFSNADRKVNLNTATQAELIALPGIGPSTANRILALRRVRSFTKVEDLLQVRGIGESKLNKLRPYVTVE